MRTHRVFGLLLTAYLALLAVVLLQPSPTIAAGTVGQITEWLEHLGASARVTSPGRVEMVLNAAMFAPAAALASLTWPRVPWTGWVAYGFVGSASVELAQGLLLAARTAQHVDVVANTAGALAGASAVRILGRIGPGPSADETIPRA